MCYMYKTMIGSPSYPRGIRVAQTQYYWVHISFVSWRWVFANKFPSPRLKNPIWNNICTRQIYFISFLRISRNFLQIWYIRTMKDETSISQMVIAKTLKMMPFITLTLSTIFYLSIFSLNSNSYSFTNIKRTIWPEISNSAHMIEELVYKHLIARL